MDTLSARELDSLAVSENRKTKPFVDMFKLIIGKYGND